jgi:hypothetical protein
VSSGGGDSKGKEKGKRTRKLRRGRRTHTHEKKGERELLFLLQFFYSGLGGSYVHPSYCAKKLWVNEEGIEGVREDAGE